MKERGIAFSGGGFRATLFAVGSLIRINEEGLLKTFDTFTSVSGGAIAIGYLSLVWDKLNFIPHQTKHGLYYADNFFEVFVEPLMTFCERSIDIKAITRSIFTLKRPCYALEDYYNKYLFNDSKLEHITNETEFIFYGTNYDTGASVRLTRDSIRDYQLGTATKHGLKLSSAVAISSSFPPFMSPYVIKNPNMEWQDSTYSQIRDQDKLLYLRQNMRLVDGGLYDNLGIEALWKTKDQQEYKSVFVADAGAPFSIPQFNNKFMRKFQNCIILQQLRVTDIIIQQQRALRKRWLISNYNTPGCYNGIYWGIDTDIRKYNVEHIMKPESRLLHLSQCKSLSTQLSPFKLKTNKDICNYAYALCDAALLSYNRHRAVESKFPF
ncbi:patatin-like phospholipase family protein [Aeromonas hydrophila]|uniref:patatin-like phospholipase family protein n=1 Tax=Aeromonas hydrophila TaxID=644 RepID=UPI001A2FAE7F|nr:patatin-like phospholipase family protein [Aeromonas hydrophila]HAT2573903.1 patatin-like phospholipase family protein [Aeromonas hydrophila]HAT2578720.1 patatin-like phospholipase family protein [Aeromonas hydrophila]HAT2637211.1 patatin-like phospholipase family protein [Aeromonas hydrophila]HAT3421988.1 patatin-like phospholipase family protein [Aeromonas hydrophila]